MKKIKVILLTNNIAPYRIPLFNKLAEENSIEFKVLFMKEKEFNRQWNVYSEDIKFNYEILPGFHFSFKNREWELHLNRRVIAKMVRENPGVVILGGYDSPTVWYALLYCKLFGKKAVSWVGSSLLSTKAKSSLVRIMKQLFVKWCNAYVTYGIKAAEYLKILGADERKIFVGCNIGDVDFYRNMVSFYRKQHEFQHQRALYPRILFLFVGQLIERKGLRNLLKAFEGVVSNEWKLLLAGDGPQRLELEQFCKSKELTDNVEFLGFIQREQLAKYYALADILIFPSLYDPFSIVMSEALNSGLFALASKYDGSIYDLILEGVNGWIIDPYDINDLRQKLKTVIKAFDFLPSKMDISNSVKTLSPINYAEKFLEAIEFVR